MFFSCVWWLCSVENFFFCWLSSHSRHSLSSNMCCLCVELYFFCSKSTKKIYFKILKISFYRGFVRCASFRWENTIMRFVGFVVCSLTAYCFFLSFFFSAVFFVFLNYIFFFLSVNTCFPVWTYSFASVTMCCQCTLRIYMCDCSKRYTKNTSALHEFNRSTK